MKHKACSVKVSVKVAESDKRKMVEAMHASCAEARATFATSSSTPEPEDAPTGLPPLKYTGGAQTDDEGWITFDKPYTFFYAGQGPYVASDLAQFPVSLPNDGYIDVVFQERVRTSSRAHLLLMLTLTVWPRALVRRC